MSSAAFAIYMFMGVVAGFFLVRWITLVIVAQKPDLFGRMIAVVICVFVGPVVAAALAGGAAKLHYSLTVARLDGVAAQEAFRLESPENVFGPAFVCLSLMILVAPVVSIVVGRTAAIEGVSA